MSLILLGQLLGASFAIGINLYATVAAVGLLSRLGLIQELPPALHGLESTVVIGTAALLYLIEAIVDRVHHIDSVWDTVHTFIRPPAAALLAVGAFWGQPPSVQAGAAVIAFLVALAAHGAKAGFRVALNATHRNAASASISNLEDVVAVALVFAALEFPSAALVTGGIVLAILVVFGPRLWRAFALGIRCVLAWFRSLFRKPGWESPDQLPRRLRALVEETPLGAAPPRAARAAVNGLPGAGAYRNGWLVMTHQGPRFLFGGWVVARRIVLEDPQQVEPEEGLWLNTLHVRAGNGTYYKVHLLKDGPSADLAVQDFQVVHV